MTKLFLFDIEGTTTDISFVHKVLFPYSYNAMESYVLEHQVDPEVMKAIGNVKSTVLEEEQKQINLHEAIEKLKFWIKTDRKHGALKELQGLIWDVGYSQGDFQGHVYEDVKPAFSKILGHAKIGIYSSGSVHAQKLIFGHSMAGDLTPMISYYFDTKVGGKREKESYITIASKTNFLPDDIHFFSDIPEELIAAKEAGFKVTQVVRPGTKPSSFPIVQDFTTL